MSLKLPGEIVVDDVLPTLRVLLARALDERGLTQQSIADRLGVTQAAVSNYLRDDPELEPLIAEDERVQSTVDRIAEGFAAETMDEYEALAALLELIHTLEDRGPICELHEAAMPALAGTGCDLCVRGVDDRLQVERDVLASIRRAVRQFAGLPAAVDHVPNVGTNIAMALPEATDETEVAAVPGRLHAMRGRVNVPANPEFGASQHVARTVLAALAVDPSVRAALNLRTSEALLGAAREAGFSPREFDAGYERRTAALETLFEDHGVPRVIYHRGDHGIEPVTYVFGTTAVVAVETAAELIDRASTS
jgi:predicted fused transcriptional regulator/phosphomethylpyrimidine kinase/predicted transcriptional regulator